MEVNCCCMLYNTYECFQERYVNNIPDSFVAQTTLPTSGIVECWVLRRETSRDRHEHLSLAEKFLPLPQTFSTHSRRSTQQLQHQPSLAAALV